MPETAKDKLIRATITMIDEKGPDGFSVRDVAAFANVNHGLVHRHFGSKSKLVEAAYEAVILEFSQLMGNQSDEQPYSTPSHVHSTLGQLQSHMNCLMWIIKSDYRPKALVDIFPHFSKAETGADNSNDIHKAFVAVITSASLGWHLFKPLIAGALNTQPVELEPEFGRVLDQLTESFRPTKSNVVV